MKRLEILFVAFVLFLCGSTANADEPYQQWLKYFEGDWTQVTMGQTTLVHHKLVAGGHAILFQGDDGVVGLVGWQADTKSLNTNLYGRKIRFLHSKATESGDGTLRGTREGMLVFPGLLFKGTDVWRKIDDNNCELAFDMLIGKAQVSGTVKLTRNKNEGPSTVKSPVVHSLDNTNEPYQQWLKYFEGDWDMAFADGRTTVLHQKLVVDGCALLNQPDDGAVALSGWRPDTKTMVETLYIPSGGYQQSDIKEINECSLSGTVRGWSSKLDVAYTGTIVRRKLDENAYEIDYDVDLGGVKYKATHKVTRKTKKD